MGKRYRDRKQRNIKNNTEEEWEEVPRVVQIFREKKKRKIEERRTRVKVQRKKNQIRFVLYSCGQCGCFGIEFAQSQDLCWGDTFSSDDQRDELQELQLQAREDWIDYFIVPHKLQASQLAI